MQPGAPGVGSEPENFMPAEAIIETPDPPSDSSIGKLALDGVEDAEETPEYIPAHDAHAMLAQGLLEHNDIREDGFYFFGEIDGEIVRASSYQTSLSRSHAARSTNLQKHEELLRTEEKAIVSARFDCRPSETDAAGEPVRTYVYTSAAPSELSPDHHATDLAALFGVSQKEFAETVEASYAATGQTPSVETLGSLLKKDDIPLANPVTFVSTYFRNNTSQTEVLQERPNHATHHHRLRALQRELPTPRIPNEVGYEHRMHIPEKSAPWDTAWPDYNPPRFTTDWVRTTGVELGASDPESPADVDFSTRPSFVSGGYTLDEAGYPRNPMGRQGLGDRGDLAKWGPNQAADPVVIAIDPQTKNRKILLVRRQDTSQWALPGGMVDPGEHVSKTARRELLEETGVDLGDVEGEVVYEGYVVDPRNTDNSWMETTARRFLIEHTPDATEGDDAVDARWFDANNLAELEADMRRLDEALGEPPQPLYASHGQIIEKALR
jgi:ADP-ribose pyrophosphatase